MGAKHRFLIAAAAWVVVPLASANAQDSGALVTETQVSDEDIVVTATRGNQTLQKTPVAISAVSAETIEARGITSLTGLTNVVPAAKINYSLGAVQLNVRGVGSEIDLPYVPEPAGINFNDVYIPRLATNTTIMDIEQIEILPGPQGTLYGKGALGGVTNIRSAMPKNELGFKVTGEAGNYELLKLTAIANLPLTGDLAVRIAGSTTHRGAYFSNGNDTDEAKTIRLSMLWNPSDKLEIYLWGQYYHNRLKPQATSYLKPFLNDDPYDQPQFDPGVAVAGLFPAPGNDVSRSTLFLRGIVTGGRITYDLGNLKIQYIPSYIHYLDDDLRFLQGLSTVSDGTIDQTTHELRFSGDLTERLSWLGSLYYYHNKSDIDSTLSASFGQVAGNRLLHRHMVPGAALRQEAHGTAVDQIGRVQVGLAPDLALEAVFGEIGRKGDARLGIAQRRRDFGGIGTDGGHDAKTCYYNPSHLSDLLYELQVRTGPVQAVLSFDRPTRRSVA